ncbi:MAG: YfcC family protein [Eubacteriales bacterium]|nr:YfcC family protein [Eubacteriales bacterium]
MEQNVKRKPKFKVPHTFIILLALIFIVAVMTYFVPAGTYDRHFDEATGRQLVDPNSYHEVEKNPTTIIKFFSSSVDGMVDAGYVVVLTFAVGGGFFVLERAGIITSAIQALAKKLKKRGIIMIPILMIVFALLDCFVGMCELTMVYVPIILPLMLAMGFDSMTACATALIGSQVGFTLALANPFTTIIGQKISGLPLMSGWQYRLILLIVYLAVAIWFVCRYAARVQKNPLSSSMYEIDLQTREELGSNVATEAKKMTVRQKIAGLVSIGLFATMVYGVISWGWDMPEIGGTFVAIGIIGGIIAGMSGDEICKAFIDGCGRVLEGALIIGVSRGIAVVMSNAQITDTIVHFFGTVLMGVPAYLSSVGMMVTQTIIEFFISSGSGQAVATMPIMAPLADIIGVTRQTAVLALQLGDGLTNIFYPVSGYFIATIGLAKVPYEKWVKFFIPLLLIEWALSIVAMIVAQAIQWGPF